MPSAPIIRPARAKSLAKTASWAVLKVLLALALFEGLSSLALFSYDILFRWSSGLHSRVHVVYDARLGWINAPNFVQEDMYGDGVYFHTNSQSFRNRGDIAAKVDPGALRVLCCGDSFTLGVGVDDDHSWPALLQRHDARLETVNLGEAGYGLDQIYLKYVQCTSALDQDIVVFAFIHDDFLRMKWPEFLGYDKPMLRLVDGRLTELNVPVPRRSYYFPWITHNRNTIGGLRSLQLTQRLLRRAGVGQEIDASSDLEVLRVSLAMFEDVAARCRAVGALPVFVYLTESATDSAAMAQWGDTLSSECAARNLPFLDLGRAFRERSFVELTGLFDPTWQHYSVAGNQLVADLMFERLKEIPSVRERLGQPTPR